MAPLNCILETFYRYFNYYSVFNICSVPSNILLSQAGLGCLKIEISPSETACSKESTMRLHKTKGLSKETDFVQKRRRGWKVLKHKDYKEEQAKDDFRAIKQLVLFCSVCMCSPVFIVVDGSFSIFSRRRSLAFLALCFKSKRGKQNFFFFNFLHSFQKRNGFIVFSE